MKFRRKYPSVELTGLAVLLGASVACRGSDGDTALDEGGKDGAGAGALDAALADVATPRPGDGPSAVETVRANDPSAKSPPGLPAFPSAEGFGAAARGGRGGKIIEVTNLNDSGPGSLREALATKTPRIVVFRVSGTINLTKDIEISGITAGFVTIAGQTSPGGIQIKGPGTGLTIRARDVIIRHLR